ncbi:MAG: DNA repair protein RecN, partial [Longimicrobiales bacterium]
MLLELRIQNLAVIERLSVRLNAGLNVLSGETGAGKSIIVGALSLLLGERASSDSVRAGADKAVVEGVFDVAAHAQIVQLLQQQGIDAEDGLLILRREVAAEGRSRVWVNGAASTVTLLAEIGRGLVDLHGQHEHQTLVRADEQRSLLDAFGGSTDVAAAVLAAHARLRAARAGLTELERRRREVEQRADYLRFQVSEIAAAHVRVDEEAQLNLEARRLEHAEELARLANRLHQELYADDRSATTRLAELRRALEQLIRIDESQEGARELLDAGYYALEELGRRMGEYAAHIEDDPERLNQLRSRLDLLHRLKTKYGPTLPDVLAMQQQAQSELAVMDQSESARAQLLEEESAAARALTERAATLSAVRNNAGRRLAAEITNLLPDLGLPSGTFNVALEALAELGAHGAESTQFRVALNAGFEPRPLARVASGGELSRIMLALKTVLARLDRVPTLVFDEIDAGIGGRVAVQVGAKLRQVAEHHQVFVITHLPQIASRAQHHLLVEKVEQEGTTLTRVGALTREDRVRELARMLGGDPE